ncbi:hypothetical protein [Reyranella sp.]
MAMQGKVVLRRERSATRRTLKRVWFLVSRLGPEGRVLLIGWSGRETGMTSPRTMPRLTLVGFQQSAFRPSGGVRFDLLHRAPTGLVIAGQVVPTAGRALLSNVNSPYALRVVACLPNGLSCRIAAARRPWLGEVIDDYRYN